MRIVRLAACPLLAIALLALALAGCRGNPLVRANVSIDWVDFVKWDGRSYEAMYNRALTDPSDIGPGVGEVKFKLEGNVHTPGYRSKNGDAAYLEPGTVLYELKSRPDRSILAVRDDKAIGGYALYADPEKQTGYPWHFKDIPKGKVTLVEIYRYGPDDEPAMTNLLEGEKAAAFVNLLERSAASESYSPAPGGPDPEMFTVVLSAGGTVGFQYHLFHDDKSYYWSPWDTVPLPGEIGSYLNS